MDSEPIDILLRQYKQETGQTSQQLADELDLSKRTVDYILEQRGFRYSRMLELAIEALRQKRSAA